MDNPAPELSPDIEWMLESGQANSEMLAEALVREFLQPVYRFGLVYLNDSQLADQAAIECLSAVLMQSYNYRGGSVNAWLFQIVLHTLRRKRPELTLNRPIIDTSPTESPEGRSVSVDSEAENDQRLWSAIENLNRKSRLPLILTYLLNWPVEQVAEILKVNPETATTQLKSIRRRLTEYLRLVDYSSDELEPGRLDARIRRLMEARWPGMALTPSKLEATIEAVVAGAEQQRSHIHQLASVKELFLVAIVVALAASLIYGGNILFPEPEPTRSPARRILVTRLAEVDNTPTPTRITVPTATVPPTPLPPPATLIPLTLQSSSEEIWSRIYFSHFSYRTLWMDALLTSYGPEGYVGAPQLYRVQIWLDKTIPAGLLLGGIPGSRVEEIGLSRSGVGYWSEVDGLSPFKVQKISGQQALRSWYAANLVLYQPFALGDSGTYRVAGRENLLGRDIISVDYLNLAGQRVARLWLDSQTGLALRQRYFTPAQDGLYYEIRLLDVQIDPEIPADLFNPEYPWTGSFANNVNNQTPGIGRTPPNFYLAALREMRPLPLAAAPPDFNPSQSELYFQISQVYYESPPDDSLPLLYKASVFTEDYFLGELDFENPWGMICDRSPDGARLAVAGLPTTNRSLLRLFDLTDVGSWVGRTFIASVTQFAFAPDSRRLAVFASHEPYGSVYVIDTDTNQLTHMIDLPDARSFVWSPDGEYLAMIGRVNEPLAGDEVIVVRVSNGEVTYHKSVDYEFGNVGDWPPLEWGVEFPVNMNGLTECALPPGGS